MVWRNEKESGRSLIVVVLVSDRVKRSKQWQESYIYVQHR